MAPSSTHDFPEFTRAVVREVSDNVNNATRDVHSNSTIDLDKCKEEWEYYVQTLRDLGLEVTVVPAAHDLPDCQFVEDGCVVIGNTALITRPAQACRQGETTALEETMRNLGLNVKVMESETATLEGGDVIFTGKEIFCGDSVQSNREGFAMLEETFPDYPCHNIFVEYPEIHLLGYVGFPGPGILTLCDNDWGGMAWKDICNQSNYNYRPIWVPDDFGSNCIYVNGSILHPTEEEKPETFEVYQRQLAEFNLIPMPTTQVSKVDAALTCQSLLF